MKKILILTVTAGEGHNSIANSLAGKLKENKNTQVKLIDIFKTYGTPSKVSLINDGYIYACKYALPIYNYVFKKLQETEPEKKYFCAAQSLVEHETPQLLKDIYAFKPDVILCTHFYCGIMLTNLRKKYGIPAKVITILTDYTVHPFWECATGVDYLITPSNTLHQRLVEKGYKESQLLSFGLPTKEAFLLPMEKKDACTELNLDPNLFTVLVLMGGGGFGHTYNVVKNIIKVTTPIQIIVVNGHDDDSRKKIELLKMSNKNNHIIKNYGFIKFVPTVMSASDIIVGKGGCITINECLNKQKVLILNTKLAQQEFDNMVYLQNNRAAIIYDEKYSKINNVIDYILENPNTLKEYEQNIDKIKTPNALYDICNFVDNLPEVDYLPIEEITKEDYNKIRKDLKQIRTNEYSEELKNKKERLKHEKNKTKVETKKQREAIKQLKIIADENCNDKKKKVI